MIVPIPLEDDDREALKASIRGAMVPLNDAYTTLTSGAFNAPGSLDILNRFCELTSAWSGKRLKPVSTFGRVSEQGAILSKHTDREPLDWTITFPLDPLSAHWRFVEHSLAADVTGRVHRAQPGEGILLNGRKIPHSRDACPFGPSYWLLLHYQEDLGFAPIITRGLLSAADLARIQGTVREFPVQFVKGRTAGDDSYRESHVAWLARDAAHWQWLYAIILPWIEREVPGYQRDAWQDSIQYTRYETGGFYALHRDNDGNNRRVLSCTILLQDPERGGELEVENQILDLRPGDAVLFPSNAMHQVRPCVGRRESLVVWLSGEPSVSSNL